MAYGTALAALSDPTRRLVFERILAAPRPVTAIAEGMPVSRPAVSQHLKVLKDAGLITDQATARGGSMPRTRKRSVSCAPPSRRCGTRRSPEWPRSTRGRRDDYRLLPGPADRQDG